MEENEDRIFYPALFLLVTGFTFLLFTLFLYLVDGICKEVFAWIGGIAMVLGILSGAGAFIIKAKRKGKTL